LIIKSEIKPFSVVLNGEFEAQNIGRELVSSADMCYNDMGEENGEQKRIAEKKRYLSKEF